MDRVAIMPRAEFERIDGTRDDRLPKLILVERCQQRETLVVLVRERPNHLGALAVNGWLGAGQHRRQYRLFRRDDEVEREMVAAELNHPRRGIARCPEDRQCVAVEAAGERSAAIGQGLVGPHDVMDLLIPLGAQSDGEEPHHGIALGRVEVSEPQTGARHVADGKIGPHRIAIMLPDEGHVATKTPFEKGGCRDGLNGKRKKHAGAEFGRERVE